MTLDIYAGLFQDDLDDVAARLDVLVPQMGPDGPVPAVRDAGRGDEKGV